MKVWRLVSHHVNPVEVAQIYKEQGFIAVGWGHTEDLREQPLSSPQDINVWC